MTFCKEADVVFLQAPRRLVSVWLLFCSGERVALRLAKVGFKRKDEQAAEVEGSEWPQPQATNVGRSTERQVTKECAIRK